MADERYLVDSNILLRWVQPADPDSPTVVVVLRELAKSGAVLCYTSQSMAEFGAPPRVRWRETVSD